MIKIIYECVCCKESCELEFEAPDLSNMSVNQEPKVLYDKNISCKHCYKEYGLSIVKGHSPICDVIYDDNQEITFNKDSVKSIVYSIGEYDRGVQDESYYADLLEAHYEKILEEEKKYKDNIQKLGKEGEENFKNLLDESGFYYVYINQEQETFCQSFSNLIKRPDVLVFKNEKENIYVEVKNYNLFKDDKVRMNIDSELKKLLEFEKISNTPIMFAYAGNDIFSKWYFISISHVNELYKNLKTSEQNENCFYISIDNFIEVTSNNIRSVL